MNLAKKGDVGWNGILTNTFLIMVFSVIHVLAFIVGVTYQPEEYTKEIKFNNMLDEIKIN
jgi:hypothetical protein